MDRPILEMMTEKVGTIINIHKSLQFGDTVYNSPLTVMTTVLLVLVEEPLVPRQLYRPVSASLRGEKDTVDDV